jgi:glutathione S-transferase
MPKPLPQLSFKQRYLLSEAEFEPICCYFARFGAIADFQIFNATPKVINWRSSLQSRPSVIRAVTPEYPERLAEFLKKRPAYLATLIR